MKRSTGILCWLILGIIILAGCALLSRPSYVPPATTDGVVQTAALEPGPTLTETHLPATPTQDPDSTAPNPAPTTQAEESLAAGKIARGHLEVLAEEIGPRETGSAEERQAEKYIAETFSAAGYAPEKQPFSFDTQEGETLKSVNVMAVKKGLSDREIVVGAHYDSVSVGTGADDNASGVAVLLETAQRVRNEETPYTIRFIAFGAEEEDLDGSRYYVDSLEKADKDKIVAMINLDSIVGGDFVYVYGDPGPGSLRDWILDTAKASALPLEGRTDRDLDYEDGSRCECADYDAFELAGVPFAYFEATDWNVGEKDGWTQVSKEFGKEGEIIHTNYDDIAYIEETFPGRIDQQLAEVSTLLYDALTAYQAPK